MRFLFKANKGIRTPDLRITSALLYLLSHIGTIFSHLIMIANLPDKINLFYSLIRNFLFSKK